MAMPSLNLLRHAGLAVGGLFLLAACDQSTPQQKATQEPEPVLPTFEADRIEAHVEFLADDLMQGRNTGTLEYDIAANYVASRFKALGLAPAGVDDSYFQPVTFTQVSPVADAALLSVRTPDGTTTLEYLEDFLVSGRAMYDHSAVNAPVVFVGYGISAPGFGHDDYAELDVEGKVVAVLSGAPSDWPSEERAHFASGRTKAEIASERGAVGMINLLDRAAQARWPYERLKESADRPGLTWLRPDGTGFSTSPNLEVVATLNPAASDILFTGTGKTFGDIQAAAEAGAPAPMALNVEVTMAQKSRYENITSANVAAMLTGSDPALAEEVVVISGHLDHVGVGREVDGDAIYNGAMDNAAGIATMLEVARVMATQAERPKRSIMFLAVTAEEMGLLGAEYFAYYPTVPAENIIANVNLDMPVLLYDFADVIAFGAEHSSLGPTVAAAVERVGVTMSPDPMPEQGIFTRSDHYRFVQKGIPAVFLATGWGMTEDGTDGGAVWNDFFATHYHKPSDAPDLPFDYDAGAKFALINWLIIDEIANDSSRPVWNDDSFFGNLYGDGAAGDQDQEPSTEPASPVDETLDAVDEAGTQALDAVEEAADELTDGATETGQNGDGGAQPQDN